MLRGRIGWDGLVFLGLVALLVGLGAYYALSPGATAAIRDESPWYGNWGTVAFAVLLFSAFVVGFLRPFKRRDWRGLGIAEAYLVALFTEMFGDHVPYSDGHVPPAGQEGGGGVGSEVWGEVRRLSR